MEVGGLIGEVVLVLAGEFQGRIGLCDDCSWKRKDEFEDWEISEYVECGLQLYDYSKSGRRVSKEVPVGIVYFGKMFSAVDCGDIPLIFLRRATMADLVGRLSVLSTPVMHHALNINGSSDYREMASLLAEQNLVLSTAWKREVNAMNVDGNGKSVFLCHASSDKPFVRAVYNDLASLGFKPWLDEFEIRVGESIVEKISAATSSAHAVVVFLSKSSIDAPWVKREWQSVLMRTMAGSGVLLLPARIEKVNPPALMADMLYADFSDSYQEGLRSLIRSL